MEDASNRLSPGQRKVDDPRRPGEIDQIPIQDDVDEIVRGMNPTDAVDPYSRPDDRPEVPSGKATDPKGVRTD